MATAAEVVTALKAAMEATPGVSEIMVDGFKVVLDRKALEYWERRAAREETIPTRPTVMTVNLNQAD